MSKLVDVYRSEKQPTLSKRQLPLTVDENLTMVMDLNGMGLVCDGPLVRGKELEEFSQKFNMLTRTETMSAFAVTCKDLLEILGQTVPCVGCRRRSIQKSIVDILRCVKFLRNSTRDHPEVHNLQNLPLKQMENMTLPLDMHQTNVLQAQSSIIHGLTHIDVERLFYQLMKSGHPTLDPLYVSTEGILSIRKEQLQSPQVLCTLLHGHSSRLSNLVESQPRSKKSRRCNLHSLDSQRSRPMTTNQWVEVWECMRPQCKEEVVLIESSTLLTTLENYLRKHRFCGECRTKVLRAYTLLVEEPDPCREKGYIPALYLGIKRCIPEKHIHLQTRTAYISNLIGRAEPELLGSRRERHAKTLEIAQEEVLTCLGLCVYERLHRINLRLREEECTCRVLAAVAVETLCRNFEMAVELKRGVSQLELLYEQITKEELAKQQRKEHKKQKRRKKKEKRAEMDEKENCECEIEDSSDHPNSETICHCSYPDSKPAVHSTDRHKLQVLDRKTKGSPTCHCEDCSRRNKEISDSRTVEESVKKIPEKQNQTPRKGISSCSPKESPGNGNSVTPSQRNSLSLSPASDNPQKQCSLSPCQSCKSAQDLEETPTTLISGNTTLKDSTSFNGNWSSSEHSQDCGYSSENNNGCCDTGSGSSCLPSSPEGSEVACSDGFCNHEGECNAERNGESHTCERMRNGSSGNTSCQGPGGLTMTLQQMLEESCSSDEESYIPVEEIQEFKSRMRHVAEKRQELRQRLKRQFDELCINQGSFTRPAVPPSSSSVHCDVREKRLVKGIL